MFTPTVYSIESSSEFGQYKPLHDQELKKKLTETVARLPRIHRSCADILNGNPSAPSGYYNIITTNGSSIQVYSVTWRGPTVEEREAGRGWLIC